MNLVQKTVLGGCAALAIAGAAFATGALDHHLEVNLPGGGVAHISYAGDVAPRVEVVPAASASASGAAFPGAVAVGPMFFAGFDNFDRVFADMDRRMAKMSTVMQRAAVPGGDISRVALQSLPPGAVSYSVVTTSDGTHSCTRSTTMTAASGGAKPQLISKTSGDCGPEVKAPDGPVMASAKAVPPAVGRGDRPVLVSAEAPAAARQVGHY